MARYALIKAGKVANVIVADDTFSLPPSYSAMVPAPDTVSKGYLWDGNTFSAPPPPPASTQWTVPLTVLLERLSDADAELIFTWVEARPAKQRARLRAGVAVDTVTPSATETAIRTELTNRGYNPNVVLAQP